MSQQFDVEALIALLNPTTIRALYAKHNLRPSQFNQHVYSGRCCGAGIALVELLGRQEDRKTLNDLVPDEPRLRAFKAGFDAGLADHPSDRDHRLKAFLQMYPDLNSNWFETGFDTGQACKE